MNSEQNAEQPTTTVAALAEALVKEPADVSAEPLANAALENTMGVAAVTPAEVKHAGIDVGIPAREAEDSAPADTDDQHAANYAMDGEYAVDGEYDMSAPVDEKYPVFVYTPFVLPGPIHTIFSLYGDRLCDFCRTLRNLKWDPLTGELKKAFCKGCRIIIGRCPEHKCECGRPRWVDELGGLALMCKPCHKGEADGRAGRREQELAKPMSSRSLPRRGAMRQAYTLGMAIDAALACSTEVRTRREARRGVLQSIHPRAGKGSGAVAI